MGEGAPRIDKIRNFFNHPGFVEAYTERVSKTLGQIDPARRDKAAVFFSAHSIPVAMAERCSYVAELTETCPSGCRSGRAVVLGIGLSEPNRPADAAVAGTGVGGSELSSGLTPRRSPTWLSCRSDSSRNTWRRCTIWMSKSPRCAKHFDVGFQPCRPRRGRRRGLLQMVRALIEERLGESGERAVVGELPAGRDECGEGCCR